MVSKSAKKLATNQRKQWLEILAQSAVKSEAGNFRVLIDTNVWYSAILYGGNAELVVRFCKQNYFIVSSKYLIDELLNKLKEAKAPYKWRNAVEDILKRLSEVVEPPDLPSISRDPKDDPVVATALTGNCDYLITGDQDLLVLERYQNLRIIGLQEFLNLPKVKKYIK